MNKNMRKMYTEKQIVDLAQKHISGGTQWYKHTLTVVDGELGTYVFEFLSTSEDTSLNKDLLISSSILISAKLNDVDYDYPIKFIDGKMFYLQDNEGSYYNYVDYIVGTTTNHTKVAI